MPASCVCSLCAPRMVQASVRFAAWPRRARPLDLDGDLNKRQRGAAQGLVFAEDERRVATDWGVFDGDGR